MKEYKDIREQLSSDILTPWLEYDEKKNQPYFIFEYFIKNIIDHIKYCYAVVYNDELYYNFQEPGCPKAKKIWWKLDIKNYGEAINKDIILIRTDKRIINNYNSFFNPIIWDYDNRYLFSISFLLPAYENKSNNKKLAIFNAIYMDDKYKNCIDIAEDFQLSSNYISLIRREYTTKIICYTKNIIYNHFLKIIVDHINIDKIIEFFGPESHRYIYTRYFKTEFFRIYRRMINTFGVLNKIVNNKKIYNFIIDKFINDNDICTILVPIEKFNYNLHLNINISELYYASDDERDNYQKEFIKHNKEILKSLNIHHLPKDASIYLTDLYLFYSDNDINNLFY